MALGNTQVQRKNSIFVDLKFNPTKGPSGVGFRRMLTKVPSLTEGKKFDYTYSLHDLVDGPVVGFRIKEEPVYEKPHLKEFIGYVEIADLTGGENVIVKFPLASVAGRKLVGLINTVKDQSVVVFLRTNMAEAGTVIGDMVLDKPTAFLNMYLNDAKGEKVIPSYAGPDGQTLVNPEGKLTQMVKGVKHTVGKNVLWDFTDADDMTLNTAGVVVTHFSKAAPVDGHKQGQDHDDSSVDLNEAAQAAAPRG